MRKKLLLLLLPWILLPLLAFAGPYQRNQARPVERVVFGEVTSVRYITQQEIDASERRGWETLLGGVIGGLIGNQFGSGAGREVATAAGVMAGAALAHQRQPRQALVHYQLVELLIQTEDGRLIDVIQDVDPKMLFQRGDRIRILYFRDGVRVDKTF
ncbi:glycine zipper 2TM domain-containing protein [Photobacterium atrarenae]|uniref:Glycine zipper 2TM domain-containing protein n=1 Tax=Photobacterium atrarenae TaxID=865757 RepID=A0ABY5GJA9_9GAMM|nr:glycine zipper 2TM domain-containing protein [Photobacterium atrarenae]UTV29297.1 glycine zipper 2TM domain-containing protein [Photobacterium atrarenae]